MEKLELKNRKGQKIVGVLEKPDGVVKGTCVIVHGYSGYKEQVHMQYIKNAFLDNGFVTFNFDTTNTFGESDGKFEDARLGLHYEDLEDVTKWVQQQDWFQKPLALVGHSMGGYAVARYAEDYPKEVDLCAPIAPVVSGKLSFEGKDQEKLKKWKETGWSIRESVDDRTGEIIVKRSPWGVMEERLDHDLLPNANKLTMPMFLYIGTEDTSILPEHLEILYKAIPEGNKKMVLAEGAPHTYKTKEDNEHLYNHLSEWIKSVLA